MGSMTAFVGECSEWLTQKTIQAKQHTLPGMLRGNNYEAISVDSYSGI